MIIYWSLQACAASNAVVVLLLGGGQCDIGNGADWRPYIYIFIPTTEGICI